MASKLIKKYICRICETEYYSEDVASQCCYAEKLTFKLWERDTIKHNLPYHSSIYSCMQAMITTSEKGVPQAYLWYYSKLVVIWHYIDNKWVFIEIKEGANRPELWEIKICNMHSLFKPRYGVK